MIQVQMSILKSLLHDFIGWVECLHSDPRRAPVVSDFSRPIPAEELAHAQAVLEFAIESDLRVILFANQPLRSVIGALVLGKANMTISDVRRGNFSDEEFARLTEAVSAVAWSCLELRPASVEVVPHRFRRGGMVL